MKGYMLKKNKKKVPNEMLVIDEVQEMEGETIEQLQRRLRKRPKIVDEEERNLSALNNLDVEEISEDFSDSPFLDY